MSRQDIFRKEIDDQKYLGKDEGGHHTPSREGEYEQEWLELGIG